MTKKLTNAKSNILFESKMHNKVKRIQLEIKLGKEFTKIPLCVIIMGSKLKFIRPNNKIFGLTNK
jgi:hypothetical protein